MSPLPEGDQVRAAGILLLTTEPAPKFLLMRHPKRWDLPKGHCEAGESWQETALRETHEETGIQPEQIVLDPDFRFTLSYPVKYKRWAGREFNKTVYYFLGRIPAPVDLKLTEHDSFQWFDWNPPHEIQSQTIDPLLAAVAEFL